MFGKIQHFRPDKGWGFIRVADRPEDLFFNARVDFDGDHSLLQKGTTVEFKFRLFKGNEIAGDIQVLHSADAEVTPENQAAKKIIRTPSTPLPVAPEIGGNGNEEA